MSSEVIVCKACGYEHFVEVFFCSACGEPLKGNAPLPNVLPPGVKLHNDQYTVGRILGQGGFGITYLGSDMQLARPVAIKEFFPSGCARMGSKVVPSGPISKTDFEKAKRRFVDEGELLKRFNHPGIVRVHSTFEDNSTAYIVMECLRGKELEGAVRARGGKLPEDEAVDITLKLLEALKQVHEAGLLHRDIKPQNIMLTEDGRVVLVDFGTARAYAEGILQKHTVQVTPGFAPLELYSQRALRGPFSDIYACAATLYYVLCGVVPVPSMDRAVGVPLTNIADLVPNLNESVAKAIMTGLQMDWSLRPQDVTTFVRLLKGLPATPSVTTSVRVNKKPETATEATPEAAGVTRLNGHINWVRSLVFSKDGMLLASGSDDKTVRIWNVGSMKEVRCIKGHTGWIRAIGFPAEPNRVVSGSRDHTIRVWSILSGGEEARMEAADGVLCMAFSPDGHLMATGAWDPRIVIWDPSTSKEVKGLTGHGGPVAGVAFSPDAKRLASVGLDDCTVRVWDLENGKEQLAITGHHDWMSGIAFSPDGKTLASSAYDNTIRLWDSATGEELKRIEEKSSILCVAFSPDGRHLAYGTWQHEVVLWRVSDWTEDTRMLGHEGPVCALAFSPQSLLASGSHDRTIRVWQPKALLEPEG